MHRISPKHNVVGGYRPGVYQTHLVMNIPHMKENLPYSYSSLLLSLGFFFFSFAFLTFWVHDI